MTEHKQGKVRIAIFYENNVRFRTLKPGDPVRLPGYFGSFADKDGFPRSIMLCKKRRDHTNTSRADK